MSTSLQHLFASAQPIRVLDAAIPLTQYVPIDLSVTSKALKHTDVSSSSQFTNYIFNYLNTHQAQVAFGGYLEQRNIYKRSTYFNSNVATERNIHLGVDFWCDAGTQVLAAFNGEVHSFKNNTNFGDYGPTIILKHELKGVVFYSLYGHLSLASIDAISIGDVVRQGEMIGRLGTAKVNGDYAPHLHFQIIYDLQDYFGDYPGVCSAQDVSFYKQNCPNPLDVLGYTF